jgi:hypothetical protein
MLGHRYPMTIPATTATRIWKNKDLYKGFFAAGVEAVSGAWIFKECAYLCMGPCRVTAGITQDAMSALFPDC